MRLKPNVRSRSLHLSIYACICICMKVSTDMRCVDTNTHQHPNLCIGLLFSSDLHVGREFECTDRSHDFDFITYFACVEVRGQLTQTVFLNHQVDTSVHVCIGMVCVYCVRITKVCVSLVVVGCNERCWRLWWQWCEADGLQCNSAYNTVHTAKCTTCMDHERIKVQYNTWTSRDALIYIPMFLDLVGERNGCIWPNHLLIAHLCPHHHMTTHRQRELCAYVSACVYI